MKISIIGTGYVGLTVGTCLAESGNNIICMDKDSKKIKELENGKPIIYEPELGDLINRNVKASRLMFTTDLKLAVQNSDLIFITLGTPCNEDGSADLSSVFEVAEEIGKVMESKKIIIIKSTVPIGTSKKVSKLLADFTDQEFDVVSNPEFLKEGNAVEDFMKPDRIVIGADDDKTADILTELYSPFVRTTGNPILTMSTESAEMTKYAANAMLATKISLMNDLANLCEHVGGDIEEVRRGIGADHRIGTHFIFAGVGYGGSCFPKDVKAIIKMAEEDGYSLRVPQAVDLVNENQKKSLSEKIYQHFNGNLKQKKIAIWGLSFKPRTDDMRGAPSITIINELLKYEAKIHAYDPVANGTAKSIFGNQINYFEDPYEAVMGTDAVALVTEWNQFKRPDFDKVRERMKSPVIFDGRNIYDPKKLKKLGFKYYGIGRSAD